MPICGFQYCVTAGRVKNHIGILLILRRLPILHSNCKITTSNTPSLVLHIFLHFHTHLTFTNTYILIIPTKEFHYTNTLHISTIWYYRQVTYSPNSLHWFFKRQYGSDQFQPTPFFHFIFTIYSTSSRHSIHTIITKLTLTTLTSIFPNHFVQLHLLITNTLLLFKTYSFSDSTSTDTHSMHMAVFYSLSTFQIYNSNFDKCQKEFERSNS